MGVAPSVIRQWPHRDLVELFELYKQEPFGPVRDNWHMATLAQLFSSANTRKGRGRPRIDQFMFKDKKSNTLQNNQSFLDFLGAKAAPKTEKAPKNGD